MTSFFEKLFSIENKIYEVEKKILIFLLSLILSLIFIQIVGRLFGIYFFWFKELVQFMFICMIYWGVAAGVYKKRHISALFFVNTMPKKIRNLIERLSLFIFLFFMLFFTIDGVKFTLLQIQRGRHTISLPYQIPIYVFIIFIPLCSLLSSLHIV